MLSSTCFYQTRQGLGRPQSIAIKCPTDCGHLYLVISLCLADGGLTSIEKHMDCNIVVLCCPYMTDILALDQYCPVEATSESYWDGHCCCTVAVNLPNYRVSLCPPYSNFIQTALQDGYGSAFIIIPKPTGQQRRNIMSTRGQDTVINTYVEQERRLYSLIVS